MASKPSSLTHIGPLSDAHTRTDCSSCASDTTVQLCEDYGLGYLGQAWAVPGSLEHPLHRRLDSTSATGRTPQRTAGNGTYQGLGRERAAERHRPPAEDS
jgi:hypothetical protein